MGPKPHSVEAAMRLGFQAPGVSRQALVETWTCMINEMHISTSTCPFARRTAMFVENFGRACSNWCTVFDSKWEIVELGYEGAQKPF